MRIGCHAVLFKGAIATDTVSVLSSLHKAGGEGAEIGSRFFGIEKADLLNSALKESEMELSGLHAAPALTDYLDKPEDVRKSLENVAKFLLKTKCRNIIMTGGVSNEHWNEPDFGDARLVDEKEVKKIALAMDEIASYLISEYGVQINYHNHNWEFKNNGLIFKSLSEYAPHVHFALDTGWAAISGYDPVAIIEKHAGRVTYVHLRDYKTEDLVKNVTFEAAQNNFCALGEGDMDLSGILKALDKVAGKNAWAIIEYETGPEDFSRYEKATAYLKSVM